MTGIAGDDHSAVAIAAKVLARKEAETPDVPDGSGAAAAVDCAKRLRVVFNHRQPVRRSQIHQAAHVDGLTEQVHRDRRPACVAVICAATAFEVETVRFRDRHRRGLAMRRRAAPPTPWPGTCSPARSLRRLARCRARAAPGSARRCPTPRPRRVPTPRYAAISRSSAFVFGPRMKCPSSRTDGSPRRRQPEWCGIERRDRPVEWS